MAENNLDAGLNEIEGRIIKAEQAVSDCDIKLNKAEKSIKEAKRSEPDRLAQSLIDAYIEKEKSFVDKEVAQKEVERLKTLKTFLLNTKKELFPKE